jgi:L-asparaginase II
MTNPVLIEVTRGQLVESWHRGSVAVAAPSGALALALGDVASPVYPRSAIKALQAVPLIESGAADHFGFGPAEIALACGSHAGTERHATLAASMLHRAGLTPSALHCGAHAPLGPSAANALIAASQAPTQLHNNCSGKHAGMLALAQAEGWPAAGYERLEHPLQQLMLRTVAECCGVAPGSLQLGVDGCSVPVFGLELAAMASGYARLAAAMAGGGDARALALQRIGRAMVAEPVVVEGTGRLATDLMLAAHGRILAKSGAEGLLLVAEPATARGIAIKCEDGAMRAMGPAAIELLVALGVLRADEAESLAAHRRPVVADAAGHPVGWLEGRVHSLATHDMRG